MILPSAVCGLPPAFVYSFPHSLTVCPSYLTGWKACPTAVCRPRSAFVYSFPLFVDGLPLPDGLESLSYVVCRPHSFIRSPFVDGLPLPSDRLESLSYAVCRLRSAARIRLFVPHSLTVCPSHLTGWKASPTLSAVRGPHSFIRSPFVDGLPLPDRLESLSYRGPRSLLNLPVRLMGQGHRDLCCQAGVMEQKRQVDA
jgi:hypothetical protein